MNAREALEELRARLFASQLGSVEVYKEIDVMLAALPKEEPEAKPMGHPEGWAEFADVWHAIDKMQERIEALEARR